MEIQRIHLLFIKSFSFLVGGSTANSKCGVAADILKIINSLNYRYCQEVSVWKTQKIMICPNIGTK